MQLELGPDSKLYRTATAFISAVHDPDSADPAEAKAQHDACHARFIAAAIEEGILNTLAQGFSYSIDLDLYRSETNGESYHGMYVYVVSDNETYRQFTILFFVAIW